MGVYDLKIYRRGLISTTGIDILPLSKALDFMLLTSSGFNGFFNQGLSSSIPDMVNYKSQ